MEILQKHSKNIDLLVRAFDLGQVVALPTDTVFGLAAGERGLARLHAIKQRPLSKPVVIQLASIAQVEAIAYVNAKQRALMERVWPGPVTLVLEKRPLLPMHFTAGQSSVAIRLPGCAFLLKLLRQWNRPLFVTSANKSGCSPLKSSGAVAFAFQDQVDYIIEGTADKKASTIIDITTEKYSLLRRGEEEVILNFPL